MMEHEDKPLLSMVLMGHVDAGKSTFAAHLLYKLGVIPEHVMQQAESWSLPFSCASFKFARALNYISHGDFNGNNAEDKYQPLVLTFETEQWRCNLVDHSSFRDYLRVMTAHMISSHVGVLLVSADQGEFEAGFSTHGQTREHALAAHLLGVPHLLVLVNKLDKVQYSAARYDEIRTALLQYLTQDIGYSAKHVTCVPISSWTGDNLTARSTALPWYRGPDVLTALEAVTVPPRTAQPLRVTIAEVYTVPGIGTVAVGRVEYGVLHVWDHVLVAPGNHVTQISSIEQTHQRREQALPGEEVAFCLPGLSATQVRRGSVLGHVQHSPPAEVAAFDAQIMVLNHPGQIRPGYAPLIACHNARVTCSLVEIRDYHYVPCALDCESQPAFPALVALKSHAKAFARFVPSKPMVLDDQLTPFNKIVVYDMRLVMLIGKIVKVHKKTPVS